MAKKVECSLSRVRLGGDGVLDEFKAAVSGHAVGEVLGEGEGEAGVNGAGGFGLLVADIYAPGRECVPHGPSSPSAFCWGSGPSKNTPRQGPGLASSAVFCVTGLGGLKSPSAFSLFMIVFMVFFLCSRLGSEFRPSPLVSASAKAAGGRSLRRAPPFGPLALRRAGKGETPGQGRGRLHKTSKRPGAMKGRRDRGRGTLWKGSLPIRASGRRRPVARLEWGPSLDRTGAVRGPVKRRRGLRC